MKRRDFLITSGAALGTSVFAGGVTSLGLSALSAATPTKTDLTIQKASFQLRDKLTQNMVSLSPNAPPPVLYGEQGKPMILNVTNTLNDYTAMHWHGL